jgi:S-DNA-T family DNA segregation ATPase FtsK/SpoIIIE
MNFRSAIEEVMKKRCPARKTVDITGKVITAQPWKYVDSRLDEHRYEVAFYCPTGYSAQDLMQETDSIAAACGAPIEIIDRFGAVVIKVFLHDFPNVIPFEKRMLKMTKGREILLGFDLGNIPLMHNFKIPHMLIGGQSGYGKTDLVRFIILQLISRFTPDELWIDIIDGKGFSFLPFKNIPHIRRIARDLAMAKTIMSEARAEMSNRSNKVWEAGSRKLAGTFQWRLVFIDELAVISPKLQIDTATKEIATSIYSDMVKIACVGREAGVGLVLSTQRPDRDVVYPQVKQNLDAKIALRCQTLTNSEVILDHGGAEKLPHNREGRAIYASTTDTVIQIPYIGDDDKWDKVLVPYVKEGYSVEYAEYDENGEKKSDFIDVDELSDDID